MADNMLGLFICVAAGNPVHEWVLDLVHQVTTRTGLCRLSSGMHALLCRQERSPGKEWPWPPL